MENRINIKYRLGIVFIILTLLGLTACSTEKKLQKAINKHGQKESVTYVVENYPEYFKSFIVKDTVEVMLHDTVTIEATTLDTLFIIDDQDGTYVAENDALKLQITKLNNKLKATVLGKPKEIIVEKEVKVPVEVDKPCPDMITFYEDLNKTQVELKSKNNLIGILSVVSFIFLVLMTYFAYLSKRTKEQENS